MSKENETNFEEANECNRVSTEKDDKVIDHCHITDENRGSACGIRNVKFRLTKKIPVIFHSLEDMVVIS